MSVEALEHLNGIFGTNSPEEFEQVREKFKNYMDVLISEIPKSQVKYTDWVDCFFDDMTKLIRKFFLLSSNMKKYHISLMDKAVNDYHEDEELAKE